MLVVWCARSGCERCTAFLWGDAGQHKEVWSIGWTDASCYETACFVQSGVDELAMRGTDPERAEIVQHGEDTGACVPVCPMQLPREAVAGRETTVSILARVLRQTFGV